ncbi:UNKNOWN [Stylonychia lemnae]|uniref:Uncharacterized protein n=1 Tax=Stylonychia lemnae TaxID=5949 RepID=A0A077ZV85_STYLE|nr:UNKNOWN [Stylonychia lemnae]|eukprot:CDW73534.1 UNKNOWN [Stylonychia lemnae]
MNNFYQRFEELQSSDITPLQLLIQIGKQMEEILDQHLDYQEYQAFSPIAEELSYYTVQVVKGQSSGKALNLPINQTQSYIKFGTTFDIQSKDYWKIVSDSLQQNIDMLPVHDQFQIITILKQFGLLKNQILTKTITSIEPQLASLELSNLLKFFAIYSSEDAAASIMYDSNLIDKIDFLLSNNISLMTSSEYSLAIQSIYTLDGYHSGISKFQLFIQNSVPFVTSWLKDNDLDLDTIGYAASSIVEKKQNIDQNLYQQFLKALEDNIFSNSDKLKIQEACVLIQSIHSEVSQEVIEVLDRIIGRDIDNISISQIIPTMVAFLQSGKSRDKIIQALIVKSKKEMYHFTANELVQLIAIYTNFGKQAIESFLDILEPYLLNKITSLDIDSLILLIKSLYGEKLNKRYTILDEAENIFIANISEVQYGDCAFLLYFFAKERFGSKLMIQTLLHKFDINFFQTDRVPITLKMQVLVSMNIVGKDTKFIHDAIKAIDQKRSDLSLDDIFLIDKILSEIPTTETQFDSLKAYYKEQLNTRIE